MILRDMTCTGCNTVREIMLDSIDILEHDEYCDVCDNDKRHTSRCNGGTKSRWLCCDFPPGSAEGAVRYIRGTPYEKLPSGEKINVSIDTNNKKLCNDSVDIKRDQLKFERDKKAGRGKIYVGT